MLEQAKKILLDYANVTKITEDNVLETSLGLSSFDVVSAVTIVRISFRLISRIGHRRIHYCQRH